MKRKGSEGEVKVNALIVGAGRSGTTSLFQYLSQHPQICSSSIKEIHYFSIDEIFRRGEKYFHSFFSPTPKSKVFLVADTYLLTDHFAPEKIAAYNPEMKILVMLRDPVERAFSNYYYAVDHGHEKKEVSFHDAFLQDNQRSKIPDIIAQNNLAHFYGSLYHKHLSVWRKSFPAENIQLVKTSDLENQPLKVLEEIADFFEIEKAPFSTIDTGIKYNVASESSSKLLNQVMVNRQNPIRKILRFLFYPFRNIILRSSLVSMISGLNKKKPKRYFLPPGEKERYKEYFAEDSWLLERDFNVKL